MQQADRILICGDGDAENHSVYERMKSWYVSTAGVHVHLTEPVREQEKLSEVAAMAGEEMGQYTAELYSRIFEISKAYQARILETR